MTDAEALQILQDFAHAKPLRLQRAVGHIEARMLTLAQLAELLLEPCSRCLAPTPLRHREALKACGCRGDDCLWPGSREALANAPDMPVSADATSDATPAAALEAKSNDGAG